MTTSGATNNDNFVKMMTIYLFIFFSFTFPADCMIDVTLVIDQSGSIRDKNEPGRPDNVITLMNFVISVIRELRVGLSFTRVAVVTFRCVSTGAPPPPQPPLPPPTTKHTRVKFPCGTAKNGTVWDVGLKKTVTETNFPKSYTLKTKSYHDSNFVITNCSSGVVRSMGR